MDLRLQPKPEVEFGAADKGIVSREDFFVENKIEQINQYFFPAHFVRNWRPKAALIQPSVSDESEIRFEFDFNRNVQNCFVEDYAEEVFLRTPPPCFVIIGKFGIAGRKLSEDIAKEYGSVLIQVDDVVHQVIKSKCETSKFLDRILRLGLSLTLNFILALLSYVAHTPEARHRGYVLWGLPYSPRLHDLSVEQQFNYLFTWENKPTVFINVLSEDEDLVRERNNLEYNVDADEKRLLLRPQFDDKDNENEEEEEEKEEDDDDLSPKRESAIFESNLPNHPSRPWVYLPRDRESQVWSELELFDNNIKPGIDLIASRVDPQYFITVDSRVKNVFEIVKARLSVLQLWKVPQAFPFISPKEKKVHVMEALSDEDTDNENETEEGKGFRESEEDVEIKLVKGVPPQTAFLTLFSKKTISPKFRWELSHYNYICPVTLRAGEVVEGKSEYAVVFMKYIYFLRDKESMAKFIKNPRPYVLPVRPKPPTRFFILGFPFCGKTTLAESLAAKFSIPVINTKVILKNDLERKKIIYQEFCRQKAESREITRLTAQAWQDWRMEEEERFVLIEKWITYIQSLLKQRIEQFYNGDATDKASSKGQLHSTVGSGENFDIGPECGEESVERSKKSLRGEKSTEASREELLEIRGTAIETGNLNPYEREQTPVDNYSTPSARIVQAMKHKDYNFHGNSLEVEANLFFSSLWNSFSNDEQEENFSEKELKIEEEEEEENESRHSMVKKQSNDSVAVNWCNLLPPQSLSSFILRQKSDSIKERRKSFCALLDAASKAYWVPSSLKTEFVKWRLPCFMDIPLCKIYLDNPLLLLRYCPDWLKERPLFPDSIDPIHPSVSESGRKAFKRASIVTLSHDKKEIAVLIQHAIEKAEREGMRATGEVISPGGWVVDDMVLDLEVWMELAKESIFADYVYFITDSEPDYHRIITHWCDLHAESALTTKNIFKLSHLSISSKISESVQSLDEINTLENNIKESENENVIRLLEKSFAHAQHCDKELDEIYNAIASNDVVKEKCYIPPFLVDSFSHGILQNTIENWCVLKEESIYEEALLGIFTFSGSTRSIFSVRQIIPSTHNLPLGAQLQVFSNELINFFQQNPNEKVDDKILYNEPYEKELQFFISLLSLPQKLDNLKEWLNSLGRGDTIREVDISGKTILEVFSEVKKNLYKPFIKKPRELEDFEINEINKELQGQAVGSSKELFEEVEGENYETEAEEDYEDICIYGESGSLCIVNLERNILLQGKPEFAVRYYGKLYFFWDEEAKNKFVKNPEKYAPYYSPIRCMPPVRIFVMGPIGSGKSSLAQAISKQCSLPFVDYISLLNSKLVPHLESGLTNFTALKDTKLLLEEKHNEEAKLAKDSFLRASFSKRQFWLESPNYVSLEEKQRQVHGSLLNSGQSPVQEDIEYEFEYECIESAYEESSEGSEISQSILETDIGVQTNFFLNLKDMESKLNDYLTKNEKIDNYHIKKSLEALWSKEPLVRQGFVLEGFPFKNSEIEIITENNWFPDIVFELSLPEDVVIERNINEKMKDWETNLKREMYNEKLLEEALIAIQRTLMLIRRNDLLKERISGIGNRSSFSTPKLQLSPKKKTQKLEESRLPSKIWTEKNENEGEDMSSSEPEITEDMIYQEVDAIIKEEYPSLVFNPVFETYEAGRKRMTENLISNYRRDVEEINKMRVFFQDQNIPCVQVNGLNDLNLNIIDVFIRLNSLKKRINQKGEFAFTMKMEIAEKLLHQGYYFLSKFGKWCPVQVYRMKNPIQMFRPLEKRGKIIPVAYRNYIYFIGGENEKNIFINDPIKYTFNEPHFPNIPLRIAVIGPPKSGKSALCSRLGLMFDLKVVTMGTALRFVTEEMPGTKLQKTMDDYLRRGCFLPLSIKIEALIACLNDPKCVTQGFIFDGIPFDAATAQSLAEKGKFPFVIITLVAESDFGKRNREKVDLNRFRFPHKQRVNLDLKYKEWDKTYKRFAQWNQDTYNNLYELNAKLSMVDIFYEAYDIIKKSFFAILYYVEHCITDRALPLQYLCVSQHEYELRKSSFHSNCPVCWVELNRLNCSSDPPARSGLVQYLYHFYWICSDHMKKFLDHPKIYFPPNAPIIPDLLPKRMTKSMFHTQTPKLKIHGYGRCPVTRTDLPNILDWEGSWSFAAAYGEEVFLCKNEEMLKRFLAKPWRYHKADTKFEVNRSGKSQAIQQLGPPTISSLPSIGFLEQTVADLIHEALQILGVVRPVYQNLTPTCTGCVFVALYLKVYNNKEKVNYLEKESLRFMIQNCRAFTFRVPPFRPLPCDVDVEAEKIDNDQSNSSENENTSNASRASPRGEEFDSHWLDFDSQADKKLWSAQNVNSKIIKMNLNINDELDEIIDPPKIFVVLKYQTYCLRANPLPPVSNCLTFIYSCKKGLKLPEPFKVDTLYQPEIMSMPPFTHTIPFNPDKEIFSELYGATDRKYPSDPNIWQGKRTISDSTMEDSTDKEMDEMDPLFRFLVKRFIPRFQLFDAITPLKHIPAPKAVDTEPVFYNPQRDHTYMILMSEFFHTTHVLRCYELGDSLSQVEFSCITNEDLGLCNAPSRFILTPRNIKENQPVSSYQQLFNASCSFFPVDYSDDNDDDSENLINPKCKESLINFIEMIILENIDQMFTQISISDLSYDSYEIQAFISESFLKPVILLREILPYPPLIWDITCRPYYAYRSIPSMFEIPRLDNIAHERHVSLLDGIVEPNYRFRFVRYPNSDVTKPIETTIKGVGKKQQKKCEESYSHKEITTFYPVFNFFDLQWTSFLAYPFSWAYDMDIKDNFFGSDQKITNAIGTSNDNLA